MTGSPVGSPERRSGLPTSARQRRRRVLIAVVVACLAGAAAVGLPSRSGAVDGTATRLLPSGVAAPVGDLPGWRQIFVDDFDRTTLGDRWGAYSGVPAGDEFSWWQPDHVLVEGSRLVLAGYLDGGRWTTGGVSNHPVAQTYGKWEVRFRADASDEITLHFLLWPRGGGWPPEIDFLENAGGDRREGSGSVIHLDGDSREREHRSVTADFTQWHTVGVEWLPGRVTYTLDGRPWGQVTGTSVPAQPMWMALQAQAGGCQRKAAYGDLNCPEVGTPDRTDIEIDWVSVYAPS